MNNRSNRSARNINFYKFHSRGIKGDYRNENQLFFLILYNKLLLSDNNTRIIM